jgi:hypothetical protein
MVSEGDYVAIFNSIHRVMKAERLLKDRSLPMLLIPAPRALSADCGLAIRYAAADRQAVEKALTEGGLAPEHVYVKKEKEFVKAETSDR